MIAFCEGLPTVERKHELFVVTFQSGGEAVPLMFTRNGLFQLGRHAVNESCQAFKDDNVIQFPKAKGGKRR